MTRSAMMIHTKFNLPVETFRGEDSLTVFSNVVPEREKKRKNIYLAFFERGRLIEPKKVQMDTKTKKEKKVDKGTLITK